MIDRSSRDLAAELTRDYRDGLLTYDELKCRWPFMSDDRALRAIGTMLWRYHDESDSPALKAPDLTDDLSGYAAFLDSGLEYQWTQDRFDTVDWLAWANHLTFGLVPIVATAVARREARWEREGEPLAWPFARHDDTIRDPSQAKS